jgi:hypothetical protein
MAIAVPSVTTTQDQPDLTTVKRQQQATWSSGDYAVIGLTGMRLIRVILARERHPINDMTCLIVMISRS